MRANIIILSVTAILLVENVVASLFIDCWKRIDKGRRYKSVVLDEETLISENSSNNVVIYKASNRKKQKERFLTVLNGCDLIKTIVTSSASCWDDFLLRIGSFEDIPAYNLYELTGSGPAMAYLHSSGQKVSDLFDVILSKMVYTIFIQKALGEKDICHGEFARDYTFYFDDCKGDEVEQFIRLYHDMANEQYKNIIISLKEWERVKTIGGWLSVRSCLPKPMIKKRMRKNMALLQKFVFSMNFFLLMKSTFNLSHTPVLDEKTDEVPHEPLDEGYIEQIGILASLFYDYMNDTSELKSLDHIKTYLLIASFLFSYEFHILDVPNIQTLGTNNLCCISYYDKHPNDFVTFVPAESSKPIQPPPYSKNLTKYLFNMDVIYSRLYSAWSIIYRSDSHRGEEIAFRLNNTRRYFQPYSNALDRKDAGNKQKPATVTDFKPLLTYLQDKNTQDQMIIRPRLVLIRNGEKSFGFVHSKANSK